MPEAERYLRQNMLPLYQEQGKSLLCKKVGIIGVGGVGGLCSLLLSVAGVGEIRIADGDTVALHNLHRQILFSESDIGKSKALCAEETIKERQSEVELKTFACMIDEHNFEEFTKDLDLLIDASDSAESRVRISTLALEAGIPLLSGAVSGYTGMIALFMYNDKAWVDTHGCYRCLTQGFPISTFQGITGPLAATISSLTAHIALESVLGSKEMDGQVLFCDLKTLRLRKLQLTRDSKCPACTGKEL